MGKQKHSKESIIQTLQNLATRLGKKKLTTADIAQVISTSVIKRYFGSVGNALDAAGLERTKIGENLRGRGSPISDDELLQSLFLTEQKIGHEPNFNEQMAFGKYVSATFTKRFGKWNDVLKHYRRWKAENPECVAEVHATPQEVSIPSKKEEVPVRTNPTVSRKTPEQLYGEPIDFRGLRHAPINEQGVVYLFGMVSRELGFSIEALQQGFPDCEGKYLYDDKKNLWAKARIEFEYKASAFKEHGHDPNHCDFVVCWINDWPDCPIDVIELKSEILKLPHK